MVLNFPSGPKCIQKSMDGLPPVASESGVSISGGPTEDEVWEKALFL